MDYGSKGRTGVKESLLCLGTMNFGYRTSEPDATTSGSGHQRKYLRRLHCRNILQ